MMCEVFILASHDLVERHTLGLGQAEASVDAYSVLAAQAT